MAPHSSALTWKVPWAEEAGGLQSMGSRRVGHNWATSLSLLTFVHWRRTWQPTPCSCLENPRDGEACWAAVYGVTQSQTRLKRLSSSSSSIKPQVTVKRHSFWCSKNGTRLDEINEHRGWFLSAISLSLPFLSVQLLRFEATSTLWHFGLHNWKRFVVSSNHNNLA